MTRQIKALHDRLSSLHAINLLSRITVTRARLPAGQEDRFPAYCRAPSSSASTAGRARRALGQQEGQYDGAPLHPDGTAIDVQVTSPQGGYLTPPQAGGSARADRATGTKRRSRLGATRRRRPGPRRRPPAQMTVILDST